MIIFKVTSVSPSRSSGLSNFLGLPSSDTERVMKPHKDNVTKVSLPIYIYFFFPEHGRKLFICVLISLCDRVNITPPLGIIPVSPVVSHVQQAPRYTHVFVPSIK